MLRRQGVHVGVFTPLDAGREFVEKLHQEERIRIGGGAASPPSDSWDSGEDS